VAEARYPARSAAKPQRHWTTQQLHDVHSMYHFIGHMERDATALDLPDVAKILAMAALALEDELAVTQPAVLTLVEP
jgi:hypothetical protein